MPRRPPTQRAFATEITNASAPPPGASPLKMAPMQASPMTMAPQASPMRVAAAPVAAPPASPARAAAAAPQPAPRMQPVKASQPVFGKLSGLGRQTPQPVPYHHQGSAPGLCWTHEQTAEFFKPAYAEEARRQAAWQQYFAIQAYMQATMTPLQFHQWQLAQHHQWQSQFQQQAACEKPKRKPRAKKDNKGSESGSTPVATEQAAAPEQVTEAAPEQVTEAAPEQAAESAAPQVCAPEAAAAVEEVLAPKFDEMSRADLVAMCKERGIKANGKTAELIKVNSCTCPASAVRNATCTHASRLTAPVVVLCRRCKSWTPRRRRPSRPCPSSRRTSPSLRTSCQAWR